MTTSKKAIIFGAEGFAEVVDYYLTHDSPYRVEGFVVSEPNDSHFLKRPLVSFNEVTTAFSPDDYEMFVAVGYRKMNKIRQKIYNECKAKGYTLLTYISSDASVHTSQIGDNCFVMEHNTIQPFVTIGHNNVFWSGNHIGHHSTIHDHCFLSSHVIISGHCTVESNCFFGVNATIRDSVTIATENLIGAGALIMSNTKEKQVYVGPKSKPFPKTSDELMK